MIARWLRRGRFGPASTGQSRVVFAQSLPQQLRRRLGSETVNNGRTSWTAKVFASKEPHLLARREILNLDDNASAVGDRGHIFGDEGLIQMVHHNSRARPQQRNAPADGTKQSEIGRELLF